MAFHWGQTYILEKLQNDYDILDRLYWSRAVGLGWVGVPLFTDTHSKEWGSVYLYYVCLSGDPRTG